MFLAAMRPMSLRVIAAVVAAAALAVPESPRASVAVGRVTGGVMLHTVTKGETLRVLAARYGVDSAVIAAENGLSGTATLTAEQGLRIDNRHIVPAAAAPGVLVVNVPQRMLFYSADEAIDALPIAVGQPGWQTPILPFTVTVKEIDPSWEVPVSIQEEARRAGRSLPAVVPSGPNNPLGRFWLGLSIPAVGIHGTNAPSSVYGTTTHGCIRAGADDIARLFARVAVGTPGHIIYEPILLAVVGDDVFLEVHKDVYRRLRADANSTAHSLAVAAGVEHKIDWAAASAVIDSRHGVARNVTNGNSR